VVVVPKFFSHCLMEQWPLEPALATSLQVYTSMRLVHTASLVSTEMGDHS